MHCRLPAGLPVRKAKSPFYLTNNMNVLSCAVMLCLNGENYGF